MNSGIDDLQSCLDDQRNVDVIREKANSQNLIKSLFLTVPKKTDCLLYYLQHRNIKAFDGINYTENMKALFMDCFKLPGGIDKKRKSKKVENSDMEGIEAEQNDRKYGFDDLFIWSLTLFTGRDNDSELCKKYLALCNNPIACCLAAVVIYKRFQKCNYLPDKLKEKLADKIKEFEKSSVETLLLCNENNKFDNQEIQEKITQDLLLRPIVAFFNQTVLDLAHEARAFEFMSSIPTQDLIKEMWHEQILSYIPHAKLVWYFLIFPFTMLPVRLFRCDANFHHNECIKTLVISSSEKVSGSSNETEYEHIPYKNMIFRDDRPIMRILRPLAFLNSPFIKFINEFAYYLYFIISYTSLILFNYAPIAESSSATKEIEPNEVIVILWISVYQLDHIVEFYYIDPPIKGIRNKLRIYFSNKWNIYDLFIFFVFYISMLVKIMQKLDIDCSVVGDDCYEFGRVIYCINLVLCALRVFKFLVILEVCGSKIIILARISQELIIFIVLIFCFLLPFGSSFESIINKTSDFSLKGLKQIFGRVYWPIFGEFGFLNEIDSYVCKKNDNGTDVCSYEAGFVFLYLGSVVYVVICNLFLLNMMIAIFSVIVEEMNSNSQQLHKFYRYRFARDYKRKLLTPVPICLIEVIILAIFNGFSYCFRRKPFFKRNIFYIENMNEEMDREYSQYESDCYREYAKSNHLNSNDIQANLTKLCNEVSKMGESIKQISETVYLKKGK